jgi:cytochrome b involved in lipid metabolism
MLLAVSILAISLSFLIYHHPPSTWPSLYAQAKDGAARAPLDKSQDAKHDGKAPEEQRQVKLQERNATDSPSHEQSPQTTPKAAPQDESNAPAVPTFTLNAHDSSDEDDDEDNLPPPSFPALNSAQRAGARPPTVAMAPPPKQNLMAPPLKPATSSLMPPPRVAPSNLRALPNASQSMRVPAMGPLPNLGLPPSRQPTVQTPNARGKVLLSPGHSPLDWAHLQKSGKNLSGVDSLMRVTPTMLKEKNGRKGKPAWSVYQGKVYNISPYLPFHPGGEGELKRAAGKDGTKLFMEVHPWVNWENMLGECMVGIMVSEEQTPTTRGGSLEDMD